MSDNHKYYYRKPRKSWPFDIISIVLLESIRGTGMLFRILTELYPNRHEMRRHFAALTKNIPYTLRIGHHCCGESGTVERAFANLHQKLGLVEPPGCGSFNI